MILAFTGDPFLAQRSARASLREHGFGADEVAEHGEGLDPAALPQLVAQGGLFGRTALLLDFGAAFRGQGGVAPRKAAMEALAQVPDDATVVVVDPTATPARQKAWRALGRLEHQPTPRFGALAGWIAQEAKARGLPVTRGVPVLLADLFGEDLPGIAAELEKLAVLEGELDEERVRRIVNRPASRDAFAMIQAITDGDEGEAVRVARALLEAGEAAPRILGALAWQFALVAKAVALLDRDGTVADAAAARELGVAPYPARKALAVARGLDEAVLRRVFDALQESEVAVKTGGRDPGWAIERLALELATGFAARRRA